MKKKKLAKPITKRADAHAHKLDKMLKTHKLSELVFDEERGEYYPKEKPRGKLRQQKQKDKPIRAKELGIFQVFRDVHGIVYLRVAHSSRGAQFVVNKGWSVELVDIDANSTHSNHLALRAVPNASIVESAKRLLHPLSDQCTISQRAKEQLTKILNTKELQMKATAEKNVSPTRPSKFANVTAPPAKKVKGSAAAPAKEKAKKKGNAGNLIPRTSPYVGKRIKVLNRKHGAREGTKRAVGMDIIIGSKTCDEAIPKLEKAGCDNSFIAFAVKSGFISLH